MFTIATKNLQPQLRTNQSLIATPTITVRSTLLFIDVSNFGNQIML